MVGLYRCRTAGVGRFPGVAASRIDVESHRHALASLLPLRSRLRKAPERDKLVNEIGLGGSGGLGGVIYVLVRAAGFLNEPALLDDAHEAAMAISARLVSADQRLDVLNGVAGALLGLLALHDARPAPALIERATTCGEHLLARRVAGPSGARTWATLESDTVHTGFSHGAAGIALGLLRLQAATGHDPLIDAAREAIEFERSLFSPEQGNWAISTPLAGGPSSTHYLCKWCYGAPGIGLARLEGLRALDQPEIRREIDVALETTERFGLDHADGLCCGNFGRVEVLLAAAARLGRSDLSTRAEQQGAAIVRRAEANGRFTLFENMPDGITQPGFFQGTAEIGYALLRLAYPRRLPCVLAWE